MASSKQGKKDLPANQQKGKKDKATSLIRIEIMALVFLMLAVFLYVSMYYYQGQPRENQLIGMLGYYSVQLSNLALGQSQSLIALFLLTWSAHIGIKKRYWSTRMWGIILLLLTALLYTSIFTIPGGLDPLEAGRRGLGGGYIGGAMAYLLLGLLGRAGTVISMLLSMLLGVILLVNQPVSVIVGTFWQQAKKNTAWAGRYIFYQHGQEERDRRREKKEEIPLVIDAPGNSNPEKKWGETMGEEKAQQPGIEAGKNEGDGVDPVIPRQPSYEYSKPGLEILEHAEQDLQYDKQLIQASIHKMEETFSQFGIQIKVNRVSCGPAVTRFELIPAPGVKVSKIIALTDDLQLNLATAGIRIEAPIPGKSAIGIEVPNKRVLSVGLRNILASTAFKNLNSPLAVALGEDVSGNAVVAKLSDMPHLLIAGATGSGKSVCLNSIIMSLLFNSNPEELKLVLIDPKMVELNVFNDLPHLLSPVVTDPKKASVVLRWMVTEMERRYRLFVETGVRDIYRYNTLKEYLPFIVIIIDELADLMMVAPVEVEDSICRLAQMSRAAGMHMIVATQRPSVDVVTGTIKANIPSRIAFAVSSQADSRTILDMGGAEKLVGKGDMLFYPVGSLKPVRVQGAYVSDQEIEKTMEYIREQIPESDQAGGVADLPVNLEHLDQVEDDELFWDAVKVFVDNQKASASLLQRRLRIGYARAARLVDLIEERGIISPADGNKQREVLIDQEQLENIHPGNNLC